MDPVALCADAAAGWHAAWLGALGLRSTRSNELWRGLDRPPFIYWTAITLAPGVTEADVRAEPGPICDSWSSLDLGPHGFAVRMREPWFLRPAGPVPGDAPPPELEVVRVETPAQVAEFERVSVLGFGGDGSWVRPGALHPPAILADRRMTMLTGRVDGQAVAAATSYRTREAVGIYGVTTIAAARGRGYASTLTSALVDPALPAVLSPSREGEGLYRRLGFAPVGELRVWLRPVG